MNTYTEQKPYVVYHTIYSGDKLPPNYIGSTSLKQLNSGYKGSVKSKNYKSVWKSELKQNPHLFSVVIISYHDTKPEAIYKELQVQKIFNVVKNPLFVNMAYAAPNGFFGRDVSGNNNPIFGKGYLISAALKGKPKSEEHKATMKGNKRAAGKPKSEEHKRKLSESNKGKHNKKLSDKTKHIMSKQRVGRKWFNDGINSYYIHPENSKPNYIAGRI